MGLIVCTFPVVLFLVFLFLLDSFKLVQKSTLLKCMIWGVLCATAAYFLNTFLLAKLSISFETYSAYFAPFLEELLKASFILGMIYKKRVGFMIDGAIYGFAIGAGFSLVENVYYLKSLTDPNLIIMLVRGFGTAFMHGGCTALFSVMLIGAKSRNNSSVLIIPLGLLVSYAIHATFNNFLINPVLQTLGIILVLPAVFILLFKYNETQLQNWLEIEFYNEIELLYMMKRGQFLSTKSGAYVASLKSRFSGETILDMYCYIQLYLELSIKAKRNVMLKESGFPPIMEEDLQEKLTELAQLRKQMGKVGELTLSPLIRMNYRDLWKLNSLKD